MSVSALAKAEACARTPPPSSSAADSFTAAAAAAASKSPLSLSSPRDAIAAPAFGVQSATMIRFFKRLWLFSAQPVLNQLRLRYR